MAISVGVRITGLKEARALFGRMAAGAAALGGARIGVVATEPYSFWIEEGRYAGGRPGQTRAVHYMQRALDEILPTVPSRLGNAMLLGPERARAEADAVGRDIATRAQQLVTVKSGRLRASIRPNRGQSLRSFG
jgi:hypothetical protein